MVFIFLPPLLFFVILSILVSYVLLICSYTALASYLIISDKSVTVAVPRWKYRWLIHLNLLFPQLATWLTSPYDQYTFIKYESQLINKIETPTFQDNSCKVLMDYKAGIHVMTDAVIMDHFAASASIRSTIGMLSRSSESHMEGGNGDDAKVEPLDVSALPPHIADEMRASDFAVPPRSRGHMD